MINLQTFEYILVQLIKYQFFIFPKTDHLYILPFQEPYYDQVSSYKFMQSIRFNIPFVKSYIVEQFSKSHFIIT